MPNYEADIDRTFRALADPTRRAVLAQLSLGPATVTDLARPFNMALPSFLQHVQLLEASGIVVSEKRGRVRMCRLNPAPIRQAEQWLAKQRQLWEARLNQLDAYLLTLKEQETAHDEPGDFA